MLQPLWRCAGLRRLDAAALVDLPWLMEVAGAGLARHIAAHAADLDQHRVRLWIGPGNNGGDGLVALRHLLELGLKPEVWMPLGPPTKGDGLAALRQAEASGEPLVEVEEPFAGDTLIVDCLFGTGLARPIEGMLATAVNGTATCRERVIACDIPSGLCGDTGRATGPTVSAAVTVTFGGLKPGFFMGDGVDRVGRIELITLGYRQDHLAAQQPAAWLDRRPASAFLPAVNRSAHKGQFGRVMVLAGSPGLDGAALLTMLGLRIGGAGLLHLWAPELSRGDLVGLAPEVMLASDQEQAVEAAARCHALVAGPGLGRSAAARGRLLSLMAASGHARVVLDADALWHYAQEPFELPEQCILTPHEGEALRLLGLDDWDGDRIAVAQALRDRMGRPVLLKGPGNLLCDDGVRLIPGAARALARGGSGDILAGLIGAIAGRGSNLVDAAHLAVRLQLAAAQRFTGGEAEVVSQDQLALAMGETWSEVLSR